MNAARRVIAIVVSLVFLAGGPLSQACMAAQAAPVSVPAVAQAAAAHHADASHHHGGHHDHSGHASGAPPQAPPLSADHACQACCAFCVLGAVTPHAAMIDVAFVARAYSLPFAQRDLTGSIVLLDPGIPKRSL